MLKYIPGAAFAVCAIMCVESTGMLLFILAIILGAAALICLIVGGNEDD